MAATPLKIAIIGAGFSGTALVEALRRSTKTPLDIYLYEKTGKFAAGDAYRTPFPYHLLNARAEDMSAIEDEPAHFVDWLQRTGKQHDKELPPGWQFVPRLWYHQYLSDLLAANRELVNVHCIPQEVIDIELSPSGAHIVSHDKTTQHVDKVVLAIGNNPPARLPFPVPETVNYIANPWEYTALKNIPAEQPVLIVGTGLSMVDAILSLHDQQHRGCVTAVSRHGLLPLPHQNGRVASMSVKLEDYPQDLRSLVKQVRREAKTMMDAGGDWRSLVNALRPLIPDLWRRAEITDKRRFLRHVLPYWNIHRHRLHHKLHHLLSEMQAQGQLEILAGRIQHMQQDYAVLRLRHSGVQRKLPVKHIINCIGSSNEPTTQPLMHALHQRGVMQIDELRLGMRADTSHKAAPQCYVLGPPMRGEVWESIAVPEIRKQCKLLANVLLFDA